MLSSTSWQLIIFLSLLSLLPIFVIIGTSFLKISVVFSLLRNALGVQQVPPNIALYSLALILTIFIMAPVGIDTYDKLMTQPEIQQNTDIISQLHDLTNSGVLIPYKQFLKKNTERKQINFFSSFIKGNWPKKYQHIATDNSLIIFLPAFMLSQLSEAFKIGLLLYLPFLIIDLVVSNILLSMGMMMMSPMTISLPFKLLVFMLVGGWDLILGKLLNSYL
ncbi:MAG: type III secretion system export apparatus subunit SctR [Plesiomonas sp.]